MRKSSTRGRMQREGTDGASPREVGGEVVSEHWPEQESKANGTSRYRGGRKAPGECGKFPNSGGTADFCSP